MCQSLTSMHKIIEKSVLIDDADKKPNSPEEHSLKVYHRCELALSDCIDVVLGNSTLNSLFTLSGVAISKL